MVVEPRNEKEKYWLMIHHSVKDLRRVHQVIWAGRGEAATCSALMVGHFIHITVIMGIVAAPMERQDHVVEREDLFSQINPLNIIPN